MSLLFFYSKRLLESVNTLTRILAYTFSLSLLAWSCAAHAEQKPKDSDCLACHSDPSLTTEVNGKTVSLYVDKSKLKDSIHGTMFGCVDCHKDVKGPVHERSEERRVGKECRSRWSP